MHGADPALTLRVYAHAMQEEENDLSFADFAGAVSSQYPSDTLMADGIPPGSSMLALQVFTVPGEDHIDLPLGWAEQRAQLEFD